MAVTDDGRWLAYSTDTTGFRQYTLHIKDLETGETLAGVVTDVVFREQAFRIELRGGLYFYVSAPCRIGETVKLKVMQVERL